MVLTVDILQHFVSLLQPHIFSFPFKINKNAEIETRNVKKGRDFMPKPRTNTGEKNLISESLIKLRRLHHLSQRDLANKLQLAGYDIDKNVITRIETNKRYVTDIELKAFSQIFHVSYSKLIDGTETGNDQAED